LRIRKAISSLALNDLPEPGTPNRNADWFRRFALLRRLSTQRLAALLR
jgi:hypothetical protein